MPWCPNCKKEYGEDILLCKDCRIPLLDQQPEPGYGTDGHPEALLVSVSDSVEADNLEAMLTDADIPVLRRYRGSGQYLKVYMGKTRLGVDLYVPGSDLERARLVLDAIYSGQEMGDAEAVSGEQKLFKESRGYNRKRRVIAWILVFLFSGGVLYALIGFIYSLIWLLKYGF